MIVRAMQASFLLVGVVVLALAAQPVLADTRLSHSGTTGVYSLNDTPANPGATCKYSNGLLRKISVQPPKMKAVAGDGSQSVGWQFIVQRRLYGHLQYGPWENDYTSPQKTAATSDSQNASFTTASVDVHNPNSGGGSAQYRVVVKMIWHHPNSSVQGTATDRVDHYRWKMSGGSGVQDKLCNYATP